MRYAKLTFKAAALPGQDHSLPSKQRNKFNLIFQITRYTGLQSFSGKSKDQIDEINVIHHGESTVKISTSWKPLIFPG